MIQKLSIASVFCLFYVSSSFAVVDVCALQDKEIESGTYSSEQIFSYKSRLKKECDLATKYAKIKDKARSKYSVELTQISFYQAMRYVERFRYDEAVQKEIPVQVIYQRHTIDYLLPNKEKSSEIWDNFQVGIQQLETARADIQQGKYFGFSDLLKVHRGFFTLSDETGDFSHTPYPGVIKSPSDHDNLWWKLQPDEVEKSSFAANELNETYQRYGLISNLDHSRYPFINQIVSVRPIDGGFAVYSGDSRENREHLNRVLALMNELLKQARNGEHMHVNDQLLSPAQLAFLVQQYYVDTHAFSEGNGRTSRFLQELIMTSFNLPHGASGELMASDALTPVDDYYEMAVSKTSADLDEISYCVDQVYRNALIFRSKKLAQVEPATLDYQCRLVN